MKITLKFQGEEYAIVESEVFDVCDQIESFVTIGELGEMFADGRKMRFSVLARAFAVLLTTAGARVTPEELRKTFMAEIREKKGAEKVALAREALATLLYVLMDGAPTQEADPGPLDEGGGPAPAPDKSAPAS